MAAGDEMVTVRCQPCVVCGKAAELILPKREVEAYQAGAKVQHAFPSLSVKLRELLVSGTHDTCWTVLWGEEEE